MWTAFLKVLSMAGLPHSIVAQVSPHKVWPAGPPILCVIGAYSTITQHGFFHVLLVKAVSRLQRLAGRGHRPLGTDGRGVRIWSQDFKLTYRESQKDGAGVSEEGSEEENVARASERDWEAHREAL